MTASVASRYASTRVKTLFQSSENALETWRQNHVEAGGRIAATLGELKGAVMKVGQMASMAADVLPKEIAGALKQLQRSAPPMDYEVVAAQIEAELGAPVETLFRRFDREPFASASIGQVHRAQTDDGTEVICKVQYPGVDQAIDSDLMQLKIALRASGLARLPRRDLNAAFAELKRSLREELDYCLEADRLRFFHDFHATRHPFVAIPVVVGERSSQRVLTMTYLAGDSLEAARAYPQATRDALARNLVTVMASQLFEFGAIHADPNPANFAFRPDGTIVLYDFGCTKRLPADIVLAYRDAIVAGLAEDYPAVDDALVRVGFRNPEGPAVERDFYAQWRAVLGQPFFEHPDFDFGRSTIHDNVLRMVPASLKRMTSFRPPTELLFIDRMVAGHYGNLVALRATVPVLSTLRPYFAALDAARLPGALPAAG